MSTKIWLSPPHMGGEELKYIQEAFDQNWIAPLGANVDGFENELSEYTKSGNVVALSSGTAAIHLALLLLNIQRGDKVICSTFTFSGSANPVKYVNADPVFVDSEEDSWNMCPELLEETIQSLIRKEQKPKAIILVHLYGMPANVKEIMKLARAYEIPVIEDAAEALGSSYDNQSLGTFGDIGILSFNGNKVITTSGGGALLTENRTYADKAKFLSTQAREDEIHYEHKEIGYNYRMSNVLAGIGRGQLKVLDEHIQRKTEINRIYKEQLSSEHISFLTEWNSLCHSNYWLTTMLLSDLAARNKVINTLNEGGVDCRPLWKPMHMQPVFKEELNFSNGVSEALFSRGVCLPSGSNLSDQDLNYIIDLIRQAGS